MKRAKIVLAALAVLATLSAGASVYAAEFGGGIETVATGCEMVKGGLIGEDVRFERSDFEAALGVKGLKAIVIKRLPAASEGVLRLDGKAVKEGQRLTGKQLSLLCFRAATPTVMEASFSFRAEGVSLTDTVCRIRLTDQVNRAPEVGHLSRQWLSVSTQLGLPITGRLSGYDPDGDALTYLITEYPKNGALVLEGGGEEYVYTPKSGYTGKDGFSYVVRDEYGNYSEVVSVSISVAVRASAYEYSDLAEGNTYAAALTMEALRIMQGRICGDGRYFDPDETVSLADFTVMAMKAAGERPLSRETFFENNEEIPEAIRGYLAAAQRRGYLVGKLVDGKLIFPTDATITRAEAAVMLSRIAEPSVGETVTVFADADSIPRRAEEAVYTLYDLGILPAEKDGTIAASEPLTRAACAEMLAALIEYLK